GSTSRSSCGRSSLSSEIATPTSSRPGRLRGRGCPTSARSTLAGLVLVAAIAALGTADVAAAQAPIGGAPGQAKPTARAEARPTPGPSAFFLSRYLATALDPTVPLASGGLLRGRVLDWRGIGLNAFRLQARGPVGQIETSTTADGQYTLVNVAPGEYELSLPD